MLLVEAHLAYAPMYAPSMACFVMDSSYVLICPVAIVAHQYLSQSVINSTFCCNVCEEVQKLFLGPSSLGEIISQLKKKLKMFKKVAELARILLSC